MIVFAEPLYGARPVVVDQIHLGGKEHTVESESESLARVVAVSEKLADIQVISQRHGQVKLYPSSQLSAVVFTLNL